MLSTARVETPGEVSPYRVDPRRECPVKAPPFDTRDQRRLDEALGCSPSSRGRQGARGGQSLVRCCRCACRADHLVDINRLDNWPTCGRPGRRPGGRRPPATLTRGDVAAARVQPCWDGRSGCRHPTIRNRGDGGQPGARRSRGRDAAVLALLGGSVRVASAADRRVAAAISSSGRSSRRWSGEVGSRRSSRLCRTGERVGRRVVGRHGDYAGRVCAVRAASGLEAFLSMAPSLSSWT